MIYIKGSPDPDAISSSFALKIICDKLGIKSAIVSEKNISLPQNRALIHQLDIPIKFRLPSDINKFDAYCVLDHQSVSIAGLSGDIPCALHIDHHEPLNENIIPELSIIDTEAGSTSSIMALLLENLNLVIEESLMSRIATALILGIQTDTDKYAHAGKVDYKALQYMSKYSDNILIKKISGIPLSKKTVSLLWAAIENLQLYKDWLITGIGYIDESNRDSIAIIADFLLKREEVTAIVVFAAIERNNGKGLFIDASFRSINKNLRLNDIIKEITPEGGARKYKGAFQINIDYFAQCPDRELLWELIKITTIEVLKNQRDEMYITEIKGYYKTIKQKFDNFFKSKNI